MDPSSLDDRRTLMLSSALAYASVFGCNVIPLWWLSDGHCACALGARCENAGKHPIGSLVRHGVSDATSDESVIREWWGRHPLANIGIACRQSGLVVVDVDPRNGGDDTLAECESQHGALPDTWSALTGGGGYHYYYRRPERTTVRGGKLPGVDLKADGGYVVAAPSMHASGRRYEWDAGRHPSDQPLAELPDWIAALLEVSDAPPDRGQTRGTVEDGFVGAAFGAAGWLGRQIDATRATAMCPWEDEHTSGSRHDSSTVIFAPQGGQLGRWHCSHEHCRDRTQADVVAMLPPAAVASAKARLGLSDTWTFSAASHAPVHEPEAAPWEAGLSFDGRGEMRKTAGNMLLLLRGMDEWRYCLQHDAHRGTDVWVVAPPPVPGLTPPRAGEALADHHVPYVSQWFARFRGLALASAGTYEALCAAARANEVHPLRDYLRSLVWDGRDRLDSWLTEYLGADASELTPAIGTWWMISAVARALCPGCKADHMLVLEGRQGRGKSRALQLLASPEWYLDLQIDIRDKDAADALRGAWIVEIGELDAIRGAAQTRVKSWLTQTSDTYRPAYGRATVTRPRTCVYAGTTNEQQYLQDATGGRRFWPIRCQRQTSWAGIERDRDQLWAEAVRRYDHGQQWWPSADLQDALEASQESRAVSDPWERDVLDYAESREHVTTRAILTGPLGIEPGRQERRHDMRVADVLRRAGYAQVRRTGPDGRRDRYWTRGG